MANARALTVYDLWKPVEHAPLRQLPGLVLASFGLLWHAAPRPFLGLAGLQVVSGAAGGLQLVLVKGLLEAILGAGATHAFGQVLAWIGGVGALSLLTTFSSSVEWELQRLLSELVNRRAMNRIFDVTALPTWRPSRHPSSTTASSAPG